MNRLRLSWPSFLLPILSAAALIGLSCQGTADVGGSEQAVVASTATTTEPVPTAARTATLDKTSTRVSPSQNMPTETSNLPVAPDVGAIAPRLTLPDLAGNEVSLSGLRGRAVLLNFWTSW